MARMPRMIASIQGPKGSGKSDISLRGTKRPVTYLDFDYGTEGIGGYENDDLLDGVNLIQYDPFRGSYLEVEESEQAATAKPEIDRFKRDFRKAVADKVGTLVVDTFTVAWIAQRVGNPDKTWAQLEAEFHGLVRSCFISPHTNLILIHHEKKEWGKSGGKSYPTGAYTIEGLEGIDNMVQLAIRQKHIPRQVVISDGRETEMQKADFTSEFLKCRDNVSLVGHVETGKPSFADLCVLACPLVDWEA